MSKIVVDRVTVHYPIYGGNPFSLKRSLIHFASGGRIFRNDRQIPIVKGLEDISFSLETGDRLALIGSNGAGKTTLLKTIGGLYKPTEGNITVEGQVSTLFNVCMGMDIERTGYHNIYYMGMLLGLSRKRIKAIIPDIEAFSELKDFLHMPVRSYSAGMQVRLGFSICTCLEPKILLLDEAIGAGDKHFIDKALMRAKTFYDRAEIVILASHSPEILLQVCNKAIWLEGGKIVMSGEIGEVLTAYKDLPVTAPESLVSSSLQ